MVIYFFLHPFASNWIKMENNINIEPCIVKNSNFSFICTSPNICQFQVKLFVLNTILFFYGRPAIQFYVLLHFHCILLVTV